MEGEDVRQYFVQAVKHIARFGETDIFPFGFERHVLHDKEKEVVELLYRIHREFFEQKPEGAPPVPSYLGTHPPGNASALAQVGYSGFRWATQIDPIWDAYLLGLVLSIGGLIEAARIPAAAKTVFSYRFKPNADEQTLFDPSSTWRDFMLESIARAEKATHVVVCDIADFYPRVYHHRVENALLQIAGRTDVPKRIDELLIAFNPAGVSYGLPVGGNAARLLAELLLNQTDQLLRMNGVIFCRYVDDYHIFAASKEEAFRHLIFLSERLLINEGLALQKSKTRIITSAEFIESARFTMGIDSEAGTAPTGRGAQAARFMRLHIRFDPYSANPEEDYARTKAAVEEFDVFGMLADEIAKSRIHSPLVKHILKAAKVVPDTVLQDIVLVLADNLGHLAPVFPQIALLYRDIVERLTAATRDQFVGAVVEGIRSRAPVMQLDLHKMYAVRVMATQWNPQTEETLVRLFGDGSQSSLVRKEIILAMAQWGNHSWLSDTLKRFSSFDRWERRAAIVASYRLRDEGQHWRQNRRSAFDPFEAILQDWASARFQNNRGWDSLL